VRTRSTFVFTAATGIVAALVVSMTMREGTRRGRSLVVGDSRADAPAQSERPEEAPEATPRSSRSAASPTDGQRSDDLAATPSADAGAPHATEPVLEPAVLEYAVDSMSVLRRPPSDVDRVAESRAASDIAALTEATNAPGSMWPGKPVEGSFRLLAGEGGPGRADVYAFRTDRGRVCAGAAGVTGGCFEGFTEGDGVNWSVGSGSDGKAAVLGFAPDRVESIKVIVAGHVAAETTVHDNTFYVQFESTLPPEAIEVFPPLYGKEERIALNQAAR
jgi:hypothetical protein